MSNNDQHSNESWQNNALERIMQATITEQRRNRRWGIFFKSLFFLYLLGTLYLLLPHDVFNSAHTKTSKHTALIDISGVIDDGGKADADDIATSLNEAFKDKNTQGIILRINSPGGSPVQSAYVYDEITRLRHKHPTIKVYAVCVDICASGAYYMAAAADEIYANQSSIVGSIGVLMDGFGFVDTLQKVGVQRRLITAGQHKGFLDPFSPLKPEDQQFAQKMLANVHQQFINSVKAGRGKRIKETPETFSGLAWDGMQAKELGLIDGFGSAGFVAREIIQNDHIMDFTVKPNYLEQFANRLGASFAHKFASETGVSKYLERLK